MIIVEGNATCSSRNVMCQRNKLFFSNFCVTRYVKPTYQKKQPVHVLVHYYFTNIYKTVSLLPKAAL